MPAQNEIKSRLISFLNDHVTEIQQRWYNTLQKESAYLHVHFADELEQDIRIYINTFFDFLNHDHDNYYNYHFISRLKLTGLTKKLKLSEIQKILFCGKDIILNQINSQLSFSNEHFSSIYYHIDQFFSNMLKGHLDYFSHHQQSLSANNYASTNNLNENKLIKELEAEKEKLEHIIVSLGIDVALLNKDMMIEWSYSYINGGKLLRNDRVGHSCDVLDWHEHEGCESCPAKKSFASNKMEWGLAEIPTNDNGKRTFQIRTIPFSPKGEKTTHVMEIVTEITELSNLEKLVAQQDKINSIIFDSISEAIIGISDEGIINSWNLAAENIFGYSKTQALGNRIYEILPDITISLNDPGLDQSLDAHEIKCLNKDGKEILIEVHKSQISDAIYGDKGVSLLIRDISEKRNLESKIIQAERMAMVGQMAAKIAHEIRNPLSSISLNSELLLDEIEAFENQQTDEAKDLINSIANEIDRLVKLTEEYLSFTRLPSPKLNCSNINSLLGDICHFMRKEIKKQKIRMTVVCDKKIPFLKFDNDQIRRVLYNLIRNSMEAMPEGGQLLLKTERVNSHAEILIKDDGEGITPENAAKIFSPFFSTKANGTGLGLSIAKQIVEEHNGNLYCKSSPSGGTTFTILLPL